MCIYSHMYKCKKHTQTHIQVEQTHTITYECVCCSMMQCVAARTDHDSRATNSPLKRECCSMLQCIAACCSELQRVPTKRVGRPLGITKECVAVGCSELQCTPTNRVEPPLDIVNTVANIFSQSPSLSVCLSLSRACFCSLVSSVPPWSKETMEFVRVSRTAIQRSSLSPALSFHLFRHEVKKPWSSWEYHEQRYRGLLSLPLALAHVLALAIVRALPFALTRALSLSIPTSSMGWLRLAGSLRL